MTPTLRVPLVHDRRFLSVNTSANYRATYYSRSAWPDRRHLMIRPFRQYMALCTPMSWAPVYTRITDRPTVCSSLSA